MKFCNDNQRKAMFAQLNGCARFNIKDNVRCSSPEVSKLHTSAKCGNFANMMGNKFSSDSRFAKQMREGGEYDRDILSYLDAKSGFYYDEPATYEYISGSNKPVTKIDRRATKIDLKTKNPVYEDELFDDFVVRDLEEETGYSAEELVDKGFITPLEIQGISDSVRSDLVGRLENYASTVENEAERIGRGEKVNFYELYSDKHVDTDASSITEGKIYDDSVKAVIGFLKTKGFVKTPSGFYIKPEDELDFMNKRGYTKTPDGHYTSRGKYGDNPEDGE